MISSGPSSTSGKPEPSEDAGSGSDSDENNDSTQFVAETDQDRRRTMLESDGDGKGLKASFGDFVDDFVFPTFDGSDSEMQAASRTGPTISSGSSKGKGKEKAPARSGEVPQPPSKRPRSEISSKGKGKGSKAIKPLTDFFAPASTSRVPGDSEPGEQAPKKKTRKTTSLSYGDFVQGEVRHRKKEALGMQAGSSRTLGDARQAAPAGRSRLLDLGPAGQASSSEQSGNRGDGQGWTCLVCTLCVFCSCGGFGEADNMIPQIKSGVLPCLCCVWGHSKRVKLIRRYMVGGYRGHVWETHLLYIYTLGIFDTVTSLHRIFTSSTCGDIH